MHVEFMFMCDFDDLGRMSSFPLDCTTNEEGGAIQIS
jgi:hypothetical protein